MLQTIIILEVKCLHNYLYDILCFIVVSIHGDVTCLKCSRTEHLAKVCLPKAAETKRRGKQSHVKENKPRVNNTDEVEQNSDEERYILQ